MATKTSQLQIRVSPSEKREIRRLAGLAGMDLSSWVLSKVVPQESGTFSSILGRLNDNRKAALAELNDFLSSLSRAAFERAVAATPSAKLSERDLNYIAAMIEHAAALKGALAPSWTKTVPVLREPWFSSSLGSLRLHLLTSSPAAFRRRNIFIDSSIGDRV